MHIRYNVVTNNAKTKLQWNKAGYKPKENAKGTLAWTNGYCHVQAVYYEPNEVEPMDNNELEQYKSLIRKKQREYYLKKRLKEKHKNYMEQKRNNYKTACQWLTFGYVVQSGATAIRGSELQSKDEFYFAIDYYYYHKNDVEENQALAESLRNSFPQNGFNYDGHIWW